MFTSPFGLGSCIGVFNWLPFFWLFWSLSIYLKDKQNIRLVAMNLVYGTIPVLIIGFSKLLFGFSESPRIFGSFIVWHMLDNGEFTEFFITEIYALPGWPLVSFFCGRVSLSDSFKNIFEKILLLFFRFSQYPLP